MGMQHEQRCHDLEDSDLFWLRVWCVQRVRGTEVSASASSVQIQFGMATVVVLALASSVANPYLIHDRQGCYVTVLIDWLAACPVAAATSTAE